MTKYVPRRAKPSDRIFWAVVIIDILLLAFAAGLIAINWYARTFPW